MGKTITFSRITTALICGGALVLGGCAWHKPKHEIQVWDNNHVIVPPTMASEAPLSQQSESNFDHTTNFAGCTGKFSVTDTNGKILQNGRAFNADEGLYLLDAQGRKTRNIVVANNSKTVLFQPDCGCGANMASETFPQSRDHMNQRCDN